MTSTFRHSVHGVIFESSPSGNVSRLREAADVERGVDAIEECVQLTPGRFSGSVSRFQDGSIAIEELSLDRGVHIRFREDLDRIAIGFLLCQERIIQDAISWTPRQVVVAGESRVEMNTTGPTDMIWVILSRAALSAADRDSLSNLRATFLADASFFHAVRALAMQGTKDVEQLERATVLALQRVAPFAREGGEHRSVALTRAVERFMWDNVEEPLTLERISNEMNCSVRALIYAFKDVYGIGPMTYWKARRINGAHRKLRASHGKIPILEIAADFGFWHMGHFSADHKTMFGMTPTQAIEAGRSA